VTAPAIVISAFPGDRDGLNAHRLSERRCPKLWSFLEKLIFVNVLAAEHCATVCSGGPTDWEGTPWLLARRTL